MTVTSVIKEHRDFARLSPKVRYIRYIRYFRCTRILASRAPLIVASGDVRQRRPSTVLRRTQRRCSWYV